MTRRLSRLMVLPLCAALCVALVPSLVDARMNAEVACEPTDEPLTYRCTIRLTDRETGRPIENARFVMHAAMPSMPMAHHMPPVEGTPGREPGEYHGTFHFEMVGEWAIVIRTSAPARDQMRHTIRVETQGAPPEEGQGQRERAP